MNHRRSLLNWLGLGAILLLIAALIHISGGKQPDATKTDERSQQVSFDASSPILAIESSPLESPLRPPVPTASPQVAQATPPLDGTNPSLTILHTNDTWGYLTPCG
jgi:hypothetical protein